MEPPLEPPAPLRQREAERKVDGGNDEIDGEGTKRGGGGELAFACQFDEPDHGGERGVLDELNEETDGRRNGEPESLRHDDVTELLGESQAERGACFPLRAWNCLQAASPDFAQEGASVDRIGCRRREPG